MLKQPDETFFNHQAVSKLVEREPDERVKRRLRAILMLMEGSSQQAISAELGCSTASIRTWTRRWNDGGYYALLDPSRGSPTTNAAREGARGCGYDIVRIGSYFRMVPLATNTINEMSGGPIRPVWFADWDRPSKSSLRNMLNY